MDDCDLKGRKSTDGSFSERDRPLGEEGIPLFVARNPDAGEQVLGSSATPVAFERISRGWGLFWPSDLRLGHCGASFACMSCPLCKSEARKLFNSDIAIHFPGVENLTTPHVFAFPSLLVCMDCGFTEFRLQEKDVLPLAVGATLRQSYRQSSD